MNFSSNKFVIICSRVFIYIGRNTATVPFSFFEFSKTFRRIFFIKKLFEFKNVFLNAFSLSCVFLNAFSLSWNIFNRLIVFTNNVFSIIIFICLNISFSFNNFYILNFRNLNTRKCEIFRKFLNIFTVNCVYLITSLGHFEFLERSFFINKF